MQLYFATLLTSAKFWGYAIPAELEIMSLFLLGTGKHFLINNIVAVKRSSFFCKIAPFVLHLYQVKNFNLNFT